MGVVPYTYRMDGSKWVVLETLCMRKICQCPNAETAKLVVDALTEWGAETRHCPDCGQDLECTNVKCSMFIGGE